MQTYLGVWEKLYYEQVYRTNRVHEEQEIDNGVFHRKSISRKHYHGRVEFKGQGPENGH